MITSINKEVDEITCNSLESRNYQIELFGVFSKYGCEISKVELDVLIKMGGRLRKRRSSIGVTQPSGIPTILILPVLQNMWKKYPPATQIIETVKWL